jgi:Domain of unknown function (DUF4328)
MAWRDAHAAATAARWLLYAAALLVAVSIPLALAGKGGGFDAIRAFLTLVEFLARIAAAIAFLRWLYLAAGNARALGAEDMMVGPGWAVGWYFVPVLNLVMPFVAMRELWKASAYPKDWQAATTPFALPLWSGCWIACNALGGISLRLSLDEDEAMRAAADTLAALSDLFVVPAALLLAWIVGRIQAMQVKARPAAVF